MCLAQSPRGSKAKLWSWSYLSQFHIQFVPDLLKDLKYLPLSYQSPTLEPAIPDPLPPGPCMPLRRPALSTPSLPPGALGSRGIMPLADSVLATVVRIVPARLFWLQSLAFSPLENSFLCLQPELERLLCFDAFRNFSRPSQSFFLLSALSQCSPMTFHLLKHGKA